VLETVIRENHDEIVARVSAHADGRALQSNASPILLELLAGLRCPGSAPSLSLRELAAQQAAAAARVGLPIAHVVLSYAAICGAVMEIALELDVAIGAAEFGTLRCCANAAIASGVMEYQRQREQAICQRELADAVRIAHDLRNQLTPALLAFSALRSGLQLDGVATHRVLERSLSRLRAVVARMLSEVRTRAHATTYAPHAVIASAPHSGERPPLAKTLAAASLAGYRQA
jgi:hypothetical protein